MLTKIFSIIISIPNTLRFNFHYFSFFKALHLPVVVSYKVKLEKMGKKGDFICNSRFSTVKLGFSDGSFSMGKGKKSNFYHDLDSKIVFDGKASFCNPFYLTVRKNGVLEFGANFKSNTNFLVSCMKYIHFGKDNLCAWNVTVIDGDGHFICNEHSSNPTNMPKKIIVGDKVWIASNVTILKGSLIGDGCVVSACSLICKKIDEKNVILGGVPAQVIKQNIAWNGDWLK